MKVQVIGSGSMWAESYSASYLIDDSILVDIPNGTCKALLRQKSNLGKINDLLITHFHGDHYFDIPFFILQKAKSENRHLNVYCNSKGQGKIKKLYKLAFPHSYKRIFKMVDINFLFNDGFLLNDKYEIQKVLMDHGSFKPAYGYILKFNGKYIGFTGDTTLCDNLEFMMSKCDYIFGDCMLIEGSSKHMGVDLLENVINKYPKCHYVVSHLDDETREYLKKKKIKNVIIPKDGEIFNF